MTTAEKKQNNDRGTFSEEEEQTAAWKKLVELSDEAAQPKYQAVPRGKGHWEIKLRKDPKAPG